MLSPISKMTLPGLVMASALLAGVAWSQDALAYKLMVSGASNRSGSISLAGRSVVGKIYVFVSPETGVNQVKFYLDNPLMTGLPRQVENAKPYDFAGGTVSKAKPFDTLSVRDGLHSIKALVLLQTGGTELTEATFTIANHPTQAGFFDQVHLASPEDPSTAITVVWRTLDPGTESAIRYRMIGETNWQTDTGESRSSGTAGLLHEVTPEGLLPDTDYEYKVMGDGGLWSPAFTTRTAPSPGPADFDVIYVADTGLIGRADGLSTGTDQVRKEIAALNPLLVLPGGDYAYFNSDKRYGTLEASIDAWFNQMQVVGSRAPMMPVYGNHEALLGENVQSWIDRFPTPEGFDGRRNYSFDVGDVHFVAIFAVKDTTGLGAATLAWIESDIESAYTAGAHWIVPYMHAGAFSDGTNHPSNLEYRRQLGPLFERLGVKLVLSSHDQSYERTYPLVDVPASNRPTSFRKDCYTLRDGVTWAKVSPGGKLSNINKSFSTFATNPPPPWTAFRDNTRHHFSRLRVYAAGELQLDTFGVKGDGSPITLLDSFRYTTGTCPLPPSVPTD